MKGDFGELASMLLEALKIDGVNRAKLKPC